MLSEWFLGSTAILIGYLLGSFPTAYIVTMLKKGVDIRDIDVGNVGAAATFRQTGILGGTIVAVIDIAKGIASLLIARALGLSEIWVLAAGFAAVLGHNFPIYIGFRGGKGSATTIGIFFILSPKAMALLLVMMAIAICFTRKVFPMLSSTFPFMPLLIWIFGGSVMLILFSAAVILFVALKDLGGMKSLAAGAGALSQKKQASP